MFTNTHILFDRKVNPSDCVDMECDGHKHAIIQDIDGTFLGCKLLFLDSCFLRVRKQIQRDWLHYLFNTYNWLSFK